MFRKVSSLAALLVLMSSVAGTSKANIITRALSLDGTDLNNLSPGEEFLVTIRAGAISAPQSLLGLIFTIDSGGGGTFHATTVGPGTNGTWGHTGEGQSQRSWTNLGFDDNSFFTESWTTPTTINDSSSRLLGTIILRAGQNFGSYNLNLAYNVETIVLLPLDANGHQIAGSVTQGFTYSVVPEPSSVLLLGLCLSGLITLRRRF